MKFPLIPFVNNQINCNNQIIQLIDNLLESKGFKIAFKDLPDVDRNQFLSRILSKLKKSIYENKNQISEKDLEKLLGDDTIQSLIESVKDKIK